MVKEVSAKEYRKKNNTDLLADLKKLREDLQNVRFTKKTGTAVNKVAKIKSLRKAIARVFKALENNGKMPRDLAKETHIRPNYVSALLAELKEKDIVECINPEAHKGKVYILTEKGKQISEFMKKN